MAYAFKIELRDMFHVQLCKAGDWKERIIGVSSVSRSANYTELLSMFRKDKNWGLALNRSRKSHSSGNY